MHRRSRHLNPKAAGALIALDARFLSLSGGSSISSWTNRTGTNNLDQATAANQPTFQTAVQGGSPVVRFDASNDFFSIGGSLNFKDKLTFIVTQKNNVTGNITMIAKESGDVDFVLWGGNGIGLSQSGVKWLINEGATPPTAWQIISATWNGSNTATIYRDASQVNTSTTVSATITNTTTFYCGRQSSGAYFNGDMGIVIGIQESVSDALRKRLERACSMAYKIACN